MIEPGAFFRALQEVDDGATPEDTYAKFMREAAEPDDFREEITHSDPECKRHTEFFDGCEKWQWAKQDPTKKCLCTCHGEEKPSGEVSSTCVICGGIMQEKRVKSGTEYWCLRTLLYGTCMPNQGPINTTPSGRWWKL